MTGLEIEIESKNAAEPSENFGPPGRIDFSIWFDLMPIAKPDFWSPALLCQVRDRPFFSRNLVKLTPCLRPPRIYPQSDKAR